MTAKKEHAFIYGEELTDGRIIYYGREDNGNTYPVKTKAEAYLFAEPWEALNNALDLMKRLSFDWTEVRCIFCEIVEVPTKMGEIK